MLLTFAPITTLFSLDAFLNTLFATAVTLKVYPSMVTVAGIVTVLTVFFRSLLTVTVPFLASDFVTLEPVCRQHSYEQILLPELSSVHLVFLSPEPLSRSAELLFLFRCPVLWSLARYPLPLR